jgi:flagellar assembly factor FliW
MIGNFSSNLKNSKTCFPIIESDKVIHFKFGIPGFESLTRFIIKKIPEYHPLLLLQAVEEPEISLIIADPAIFQIEKFFKIPAMTRDKLQIKSEAEMKLYVILSFDNQKRRFTANLKAPIIINKILNQGQQVILDDPTLEINYHLFINQSN